MLTINFNSRETYLEFRRDWKAAYRDLSSQIRETKVAMKEAQKSGQESRASSLQLEREMLRRKARKMLALLVEAKVEAQRQYETSRTLAA